MVIEKVVVTANVRKARLLTEDMGNITLGQLEAKIIEMKRLGINCHLEGNGDGTISIVEE